MDKICKAVLDKIHSLSPAGRYVIIAEEELFEAFPENSDDSGSELDRALTALRNSGYIDVKYSRGDMYCIAPLKEYIAEEQYADDGDCGEDDEEEIYEKKPRLNFVFVSAFTGGALGSLIISLIFALV